jgi:hypothetical protein
MNVKRMIQRVPADHDAEERAWEVVRAAFAEREPVPPRRPRVRVGLAFAALAAVAAAAAFSPPGQAVVNAVRRTIGIQHATPALFRLPAPGRLLVSGASGTWVVSADGSKRRLGDYTQAAWSPHGLFVIAATTNTMSAIEPAEGVVHWSLARPQIRFPRWGGSRTDTRIAYLTTSRLHVVAGDGTGDVDAEGLPAAARVAPVWRPGNRHILAYVTTRGRVIVLDPDAGNVWWTSAGYAGPRALAWSPDGRVVALAAKTRVVLFEARSGRARVLPVEGVRALAFTRDGSLALLRGRAVLELVRGRLRTLFIAPGRLAGLVASPDGAWLLTSLPGADQWIFLGGRRVLAVSHITRQFGASPVLDGWMAGA